MMQDMRPAVCRRDGERPTREDEWTPLRHMNKENRKNSCSPLMPTGPHHGGPTSEANWEDPQEQHTVGEEKERTSGSSPSERCIYTGWIWMSDVTMYAITAYDIIAYANTGMPWTINFSLPFLYLSNNCEHLALSVLYRVSSIVCLKKVLGDRNVA